MVCLVYPDLVLGLLFCDKRHFFPSTPSLFLTWEVQTKLVLSQSIQFALWAVQLTIEEVHSLQGNCSLAFLLAASGLKAADVDTHVLQVTLQSGHVGMRQR